MTQMSKPPAGDPDEGRLRAQHAEYMASLAVMARGIGHALRNPLGIISGAAQIALAHPDEPELVATSLRQIHAATMRTALLMDNLLSFAQPRLEVAEPVDLNQLLTAAVERFDDQLRHLRITPVLTLLPEVAPAAGSAALLQQVCSSLILNACQAMGEGGTLRVMTRMAPDGMVEFSIADQGCGIPPALLSRIFDPFFTTRSAGKNLGLGLTVCYSIIREHKGSITVRSQPGAGSTFTVLLPPATSHLSSS